MFVFLCCGVQVSKLLISTVDGIANQRENQQNGAATTFWTEKFIFHNRKTAAGLSWMQMLVSIQWQQWMLMCAKNSSLMSVQNSPIKNFVHFL